MDKEELRERYEATGDEQFYERALPLYEAALDESPDDARLLTEFGYLRDCHGRRAIRAAADCYRHAIRAEPSLDKPHFQLILSLAALGELDTVIGEYEAMVAGAPAHPRGYRLLSMACLRAGDNEKAAAAIDAGLRIAPDDPHLTELRGELYAATGRPEDALDCWRRASVLASPDYGISMRFSAAFLLERLGRLDEAAGEWRFIIGWMAERGDTIHIDWPRRELRRIETGVENAVADC